MHAIPVAKPIMSKHYVTTATAAIVTTLSA